MGVADPNTLEGISGAGNATASTTSTNETCSSNSISSSISNSSRSISKSSSSSSGGGGRGGGNFSIEISGTDKNSYGHRQQRRISLSTTTDCGAENAFGVAAIQHEKQLTKLTPMSTSMSTLASGLVTGRRKSLPFIPCSNSKTGSKGSHPGTTYSETKNSGTVVMLEGANESRSRGSAKVIDSPSPSLSPSASPSSSLMHNFFTSVSDEELNAATDVEAKTDTASVDSKANDLLVMRRQSIVGNVFVVSETSKSSDDQGGELPTNGEEYNSAPTEKGVTTNESSGSSPVLDTIHSNDRLRRRPSIQGEIFII